MRTIAIVLAAGQGKRMKGKVAKQFMLLHEKPVLFYTLKVFEESFIDEVLLVTSSEDVEYCRREIVEKYGFSKVKSIVTGGKERYHSVSNAIRAITGDVQFGQVARRCDYLFIHDGARPFVTKEMIMKTFSEVQIYGACAVGMPVKDTIKITDEEGYVVQTPNRKSVWAIQTPQVFEFAQIKKAYEQLMEQEEDIKSNGIEITDDAGVLENMTGKSVKLIEGSYSNIKLTTPEDMELAEVLIKHC